MRKFFFSLLKFSLLFVICFAYLNTIFTNKNTYAYTFDTYREITKHNDIDIVFFGSSHSYTSYNPLIITKKTDAISYNLGAPALNIVNTDVLLKESLEYNTPKLVVIDIFEGTLKDLKSEKDKGYQLDALDRIPNTSISKISVILKKYDANEYLSVLFPLFRNHHLWKRQSYGRIKAKPPSGNEFVYSNGYRGYKQTLSAKDTQFFKGFKEKETEKKPYPISKTAKEHLLNSIALAKSGGAEVLIITSPDLRVPYEKNSVGNALKKIADAQGVPYIDLNNYYNELNLSLTDFMDSQHLNVEGATKVSEFLGDYIKNNYSFKTQNNAEILQNYHEKFEEFMMFHTIGKELQYGRKMHAVLNEFVTIDSVFVKKNKGNYSLQLSVKTSGEAKNWVDKYNMGLKIIPQESSKKYIAKKSVAVGWGFDKFDLKFPLEPNKTMYEFKFNTKIRDIKELEISLYDSKVYNGIIGEKIQIQDLDFHSNVSNK